MLGADGENPRYRLTFGEHFNRPLAHRPRVEPAQRPDPQPPVFLDTLDHKRDLVLVRRDGNGRAISPAPEVNHDALGRVLPHRRREGTHLIHYNGVHFAFRPRRSMRRQESFQQLQ